MASRKVPKPLSSMLETIKAFPFGVGVNVEVGGTSVCVADSVTRGGTAAVLVGDGSGPQADIIKKRIADRRTTFLINFSKTTPRLALAAIGADLDMGWCRGTSKPNKYSKMAVNHTYLIGAILISC